MRSPPLRRGERLHGLFFLGLRTIFVSRSDRRRKESKQTPVFARSLDRRRQKKKKKHDQLWSEIDQTQGCASRAIDRAPAPRETAAEILPSKPKAGIAVFVVLLALLSHFLVARATRNCRYSSPASPLTKHALQLRSCA